MHAAIGRWVCLPNLIMIPELTGRDDRTMPDQNSDFGKPDFEASVVRKRGDSEAVGSNWEEQASVTTYSLDKHHPQHRHDAISHPNAVRRQDAIFGLFETKNE